MKKYLIFSNVKFLMALLPLGYGHFFMIITFFICVDKFTSLISTGFLARIFQIETVSTMTLEIIDIEDMD